MNYKKHFLLLLFMAFVFVITACSSNDSEAKQLKEAYNYDTPFTDELDPSDSNTKYIKKGEKILNKTNTVMQDKVGNELTCMSCHSGGNLSGAQPLEGVTKQYPQYRSRDDAVGSMEDRVNGCMRRSMNGEEIAKDSEEMRSIIAYLDFISEDLEQDGDDLPWLDDTTMDKVPEPDVDRGERYFEEKNCMTCHAEDGSGTGPNQGPPLWGEDSFNDGAGMARLGKASGFIRDNMPLNDAGSLSDQEAADLAAYLLSHERPEWEGHEDDWPLGDRPDDIMTKDKREQIRNGTFDWTELENVK